MGSFPITTFVLLLLVQGAGSLSLALLLGTLFVYRRLPALLFWALAWLCNGLFLLAHMLGQQGGTAGPAPFHWGGEPWLPHFAILAGWWNAAFWLLSLGPFLRDVQGKPRPAARALLVRSVIALFSVSVLALVLGPRFEARLQEAAIDFALVAVLAVGAVISGNHWRRTRRIPVFLLTVALAVRVLDALHLAAFHLWTSESGIQSEPGRGSTFRVYMPVSGSSVTSRPEVSSPAGGSECILVVDDEDLVHSLVETILRRGGYDILTACDGDEALEVYRANRERIALVLLDFSMPKRNGLEVLREMQKIDPGVCAIFSSGFTRDTDSGPLLTSGARDFVPNPYHPADLLRAVRRVLDQERL